MIQGPVHLRKLFSSFNSVFSPSCISFVLKDTFEQEIFRNYCCGETGKSNALHFIKASGPKAPNAERAIGLWKCS